MCDMCDGMSLEEVDRRNELTIAVYGWIACQVGDGTEPGWTYTVGLHPSFHHPELICVDFPFDPDVQLFLVRRLADRVSEHRAVHGAELARLDVELVPVHHDWFESGLVASWERQYGHLPDAGQFLQILPGPSWFENGDTSSRTRLDRPSPPQAAA
jgi:Domain of unknown function (DUF4262)